MKDILLVVSGFDADLTWLDGVGIPHVLYHKGAAAPERAVVMPNVGRDSHTYLNHIVENYDCISEWTVFSQDDPFPHSHDFLERLEALLNGEVSPGFTNLCTGVATNDGVGEPDHPGLKLKEYFWELLGEERSTFTFGSGAQFVVGREAVLRRDVSFYRRARDMVLTAPAGPWLFERFWPYIFGSDGAQ